MKTKSALINRIFPVVKASYKLANKPFDEGSFFFTLAFRTVKELRAMAKELRA